MSEHPATVHGRSFALVRHALRGDRDAVTLVAGEPLADQVTACMQIVSLTQVAAHCMSRIPEQERERLLEEVSLVMAQQEGDPLP